MSGDVKVIGLTMGTHTIHDIGMDVPHGVTVTIPGAKACVSKDLWRAISQKCIFQLHAGPLPAHAGQRPGVATEVDDLREQVRILTEANSRLQMELAKRQAVVPQASPTQQDPSKIDEILALLRAGVPVQGLPPTASSGPVHTRSSTHEGVVSGDVPTFIPSQIKPENFDVQISTKSEESAGAGVSEAASALRKLRKNSG